MYLILIGILFFIYMGDHLQNMKLPQHNENKDNSDSK